MTASADGTQVPTVEGPITGGKGVSLASTSFDLAAAGYSTAEYFISGTATSYTALDGGSGVVESDTADYRTRIVIYRPTDDAAFNGTVAVEWLNVSAGLDSAPDWIFLHREFMRQGYAYIGVSAQAVGVIGGPSMMGMAPNALVDADPDRYGTLAHPGDAFSFDMFTQAGAVARAAGTSTTGDSSTGTILDGLPVERVIAIGESQSAFCLTTYVNQVDPVAQLFDGALVHARGGGAMPLDVQGPEAALRDGTVLFRDDLRIPVLCFEAETDLMVLGYLRSRQPDGDHLVVWEVAGLAHADIYTFVAGSGDSGTQPIDDLAAAWLPSASLYGFDLAFPVNSGPQRYVLSAAMRHLECWVRDGTRPPAGRPLDTDGDAFVLDELGIAQGGIRTPHVDVPVNVLSGLGNSGGALALLAGKTAPFTPEQLASLYSSRDDYVSKFRASTEQTVAAGFFLEEDAEEIVAIAEHNYPG